MSSAGQVDAPPWGAPRWRHAVTSRARPAVVHTLEPERVAGLLERLPGTGLPDLYIPRRDHFVRVGELPVPGSGKTDLRAVREIARSRFG